MLKTDNQLLFRFSLDMSSDQEKSGKTLTYIEQEKVMKGLSLYKNDIIGKMKDKTFGYVFTKLALTY